ncbi:MAG: Ribosomal RNA small subunit methyltransferase I [Parcubacteria group bacterium GW2011_GWE2_38_18]|nr:MAG: Ribosomal RNA small subunit methyltransferase I [Parcubacteria group bacterium GW2011_GWE2_38_18]
MTTLYIVATPIGNLEDLTMRAMRILGEVDYVLCEDTRVTKNLLNHYNIDTPLISYHQHSNLQKVEYIISLLAEGKNLALVTDAGTPGISDPGGMLVQKVIEEFGEDVKIESVPGASAVTAALSISGISADKFFFLGFPPHKKGRQTFLKKILQSEYPVVVYESKHRIIKFLEELKALNEALGVLTPEENEATEAEEFESPSKKKRKKFKEEKKPIHLTSVVVCREISKMFETVYRGELGNIIEKIKSNENDQKGEFVVIVGK